MVMDYFTEWPEEISTVADVLVTNYEYFCHFGSKGTAQ
jgi:hypothetical protein